MTTSGSGRGPRWSRLAYAAGGAILLATIGAPAPAHARDADRCPADEWFCDEPSEPSEPRTRSSDTTARDEASPQPGAEAVAEPAPREPRPSQPAVLERDSKPSAPAPASAWRANLRLQGILINEPGGRSPAARMGGMGASLRYALNRTVTFDAGFDSLRGTDYDGRARSEFALSASVLAFLNPDEVLHTYAIAGLHWSGADVRVQDADQRWHYVGAQGGIGIAVPLSSRFALGFELLGFVRGRTDDRARTEPEFTDSEGRVTNTSGGGLLRAGGTVTF